MKKTSDFIMIYKGENRLVVSIWANRDGGIWYPSGWFWVYEKGEYIAKEELCEILIRAFCIQNNILDSNIPQPCSGEDEWKCYSKYKSIYTFCKRNDRINLNFSNDGTCSVKCQKVSNDRGWKACYCGDLVKKIELPAGWTIENLADAVLEVMQAVDEYNKKDSKGTYDISPINFDDRESVVVQKYPRTLVLSKGENRILAEPYLYHVDGSLQKEKFVFWFEEFYYRFDFMMGRVIRQSFQLIELSPLEEEKEEEGEFYKLATQYKSAEEFYQNNLVQVVQLYEDGRMVFTCRNKNEIFSQEEIKVKKLSKELSKEEEEAIGQVAFRVFAQAEEKKLKEKETENTLKEEERKDVVENKNEEMSEGTLEEFETLLEKRISYIAPNEEEYMDEQDYGAMEVYQGYSYSTEGEEEHVADIAFHIAPELDCEPSSEKVKASFESMYGKASSFQMEPINGEVFRYRAEIENDKVHQIYYLCQEEEELLLGCELVLRKSLAEEEVQTKIIRDFENMVKSCKWA